MGKFFAMALLAVAMASAVAAPKKAESPIPTTWAGFVASKAPEDAKVVKDIEKMKWWDRCSAWGRDVRSKSQTRRSIAIRENLLDGKFVNAADLMAVGTRSPTIGQTVCGVFAVLGEPTKVNQTQTASRNSAQLVYRDKGIYVYTEGGPDDGNGIVRSIQH